MEAGTKLSLGCWHIFLVTSFVSTIIVSDGSHGAGSSGSHHSISYGFAVVLSVFTVLRTANELHCVFYHLMSY